MADTVNDGPGPGSAAADFTAVRAIAPFEVAKVFEEWARAGALRRADPTAAAYVWATAGGKGPDQTPEESFAAYGDRVARAVYALLKVV